MKFFRGTLGFFLAAIVINSFWGVFTNILGIFGGYISAVILTGLMWFLNHYMGLIENDEDSAFIDMALGIAISIIVRDSIIHGASSMVSSMPTFVCVTIGAVLGGCVAAVIERNMVRTNKNDEAFKIIKPKVID